MHKTEAKEKIQKCGVIFKASAICKFPHLCIRNCLFIIDTLNVCSLYLPPDALGMMLLHKCVYFIRMMNFINERNRKMHLSTHSNS